MSHDITTIEGLRSVYKKPRDIVIRKQISHIDTHAEAFIKLCPFLVISSYDADGQADASPRGESPGFIKILDTKRFLIPDRPGNNRLDTLQNIVSNANIGLLLMVPGLNETLRINGRAKISTSPSLLELCKVNEKLPLSVIIVTVDALYMHCAKAFIRSRLWDIETQIDRSTYPTLGQILKDHVNLGSSEKIVDETNIINGKAPLY